MPSPARLHTPSHPATPGTGSCNCPTVLLTRPAAQNSAWAEALARCGIASLALPLLAIEPMHDPVTQARHAELIDAMAGLAAIMHVSPNAANSFWSPSARARWHTLHQQGSAPRLWVPGPGTAQALQALNLPAQAIDQPTASATQFDSESLWLQVAVQATPGTRILIVRGSQILPAFDTAAATPQGVGRDWLAACLREHGAEPLFLPVYRRVAPIWTAEQHALAQHAARARHIWLFSSSEALHHLNQLQPGHDWAAHRAIATHPRIADTAFAIGFGQVAQARPTAQDIAHTAQQLQA